MLEVCEIFYSLQGEGQYAGKPSVFVRLGGCNLSCEGFGVILVREGKTLVGCDSIHAVNKEHFRSTWKRYESTEALIADVEAAVPNDRSYDIVLTGGEPTLFYQNFILLGLLRHMQNAGRGITIETNATIVIDFERFPEYKACTFAMAVKLSNSGEPFARRINEKAIKAMAEEGMDSFFKFVMDEANIEVLEGEIEAITKNYNNRVYCMPMGESAETLAENDKTVFNFCIAKGYCYSDRIHIRVWGKKGGI